jgi:alkylation response protein AidB-like acyl-CoA dehydrogenase
VDHQRERSRTLHRLSRRSNPERGYRGITAFLVERDAPGSTSARRKTSSGFAPAARASCCSRLPGAARNGPRRGRRGYKVAIETLNEGRIGIGAQMIGLAQARWTTRSPTRKSASSSARRLPTSRRAVPARARGTELEAARLLVYNAARLRDAASRS